MLTALFALLALAALVSFSSQVTGDQPQGGAKNESFLSPGQFNRGVPPETAIRVALTKDTETEQPSDLSITGSSLTEKDLMEQLLALAATELFVEVFGETAASMVDFEIETLKRGDSFYVLEGCKGHSRLKTCIEQNFWWRGSIAQCYLQYSLDEYQYDSRMLF